MLTLKIAIKATHCVTRDGREVPIFKDPITDTGNFKKSQKGCVVVYYNEKKHGLRYEDEKTVKEAHEDPRNLLIPVFRDGKMLKEYSLAEIRETLHGGNF